MKTEFYTKKDVNQVKKQLNESFTKIIKSNQDVGMKDDPQFDKAVKYYDWRNHVPGVIKEHWKVMSVEARVVAFLSANSHARAEKWDE